MKYKNIIFDFDGVIAESNHVKDEAFYSIFLSYGKEIASYSLNYHLKNRGVSRFDKVTHVLDHFNLSKDNFQSIVDSFSKIVFKDVCASPLVEGIESFLSNNYQKYNFYIISATPTEELLAILKNIKIIQYFKSIYGSPNDKKFWLSELINSKQIFVDNSLFIGDASSDKNAAKEYLIPFCLRLTGDNNQLIDKDILFCVKNFNNFDKLIR